MTFVQTRHVPSLRLLTFDFCTDATCRVSTTFDWGSTTGIFCFGGVAT